MKTIIIYKSKTGFAAKYAKWISEESGGEIFDIKDVKPEMLHAHDTIVYVGGMYAGSVNGFSFIKKIFPQISDKKIILVGVGGSPVGSAGIAAAMERNLSARMKGKIKCFYLRGGYDYEKMRRFDRFIMKNVVNMMKKRKPETMDRDTQDMIDSFGKFVDFSNRGDIKPVVSFIQE